MLEGIEIELGPKLVGKVPSGEWRCGRTLHLGRPKVSQEGQSGHKMLVVGKAYLMEDQIVVRWSIAGVDCAVPLRVDKLGLGIANFHSSEAEAVHDSKDIVGSFDPVRHTQNEQQTLSCHNAIAVAGGGIENTQIGWHRTPKNCQCKSFQHSQRLAQDGRILTGRWWRLVAEQGDYNRQCCAGYKYLRVSLRAYDRNTEPRLRVWHADPIGCLKSQPIHILNHSVDHTMFTHRLSVCSCELGPQLADALV